MRFLRADFIYPLDQPPIAGGIVQADNDGTILKTGTAADFPGIEPERFRGILFPGFVNCHCHLELSHMKGLISKGAGMSGFISQLLSMRANFSNEDILTAMERADRFMREQGIVAVGDISNNSGSFDVKKGSYIFYHTFVEIFSMDPAKAETMLSNGKELLAKLESMDLAGSISPHAPYTMSEKLLELISAQAAEHGLVISIHNQESKAEDNFFRNGNGPMYETFLKMGLNETLFKVTGKSSLPSTLPFLDKAKSLILVHNTFTTEEDIQFTNSFPGKIYWCFCPNANLYIEGRLPDPGLFKGKTDRIVIGTDSLASNDELSILSELKGLSAGYKQADLNTLLTWACRNGAEALGYTQGGTFAKGKKPGINLLENCDGQVLNPATTVRVIL